MLRQARTIVSCTASSASNAEPSTRRQCARSSARWASSWRTADPRSNRRRVGAGPGPGAGRPRADGAAGGDGEVNADGTGVADANRLVGTIGATRTEEGWVARARASVAGRGAVRRVVVTLITVAVDEMGDIAQVADTGSSAGPDGGVGRLGRVGRRGRAVELEVGDGPLRAPADGHERGQETAGAVLGLAGGDHGGARGPHAGGPPRQGAGHRGAGAPAGQPLVLGEDVAARAVAAELGVQQDVELGGVAVGLGGDPPGEDIVELLHAVDGRTPGPPGHRPGGRYDGPTRAPGAEGPGRVSERVRTCPAACARLNRCPRLPATPSSRRAGAARSSRPAP